MASINNNTRIATFFVKHRYLHNCSRPLHLSLIWVKGRKKYVHRSNELYTKMLYFLFGQAGQKISLCNQIKTKKNREIPRKTFHRIEPLFSLFFCLCYHFFIGWKIVGGKKGRREEKKIIKTDSNRAHKLLFPLLPSSALLGTETKWKEEEVAWPNITPF